MHRLIFGHSFAELVAPILLVGLAFYFLNKKKASMRGNAEDAQIGASGSMTTPTETNSGGSSSSPTKTNNSASSSLTTSTGKSYEVFLNFRGPDTRQGFTSHLYKGLVDVGIEAFRDDDELCQGEDIRPELLAAITNSEILIPILSENYATSSWCLDELVQIMECKNSNGQMVLPIFYKVKPADVGHQIGSFGKAFHEREKRLRERSSFDPTILGKWRKALNEVSTLKGYEADGEEAELVKQVVQKVLRELKKKFELVISKNLVGIDSHVEKVMKLLDNKSHAPLFVGIHGMGGIGKTTLAKTIYNKLSNKFEHRSFIADIRESWKHGIHHLQKKLIDDIMKQNEEVCNEDEGTNFISSQFKNKKVLVLLDDVDDVTQVNRLVGNHDWFSSESKIIITTRNKKILRAAEVDYIYDHKELDNNHSLILFSKHAFRRDSPPSEFKGLTGEVVSITGGLPLSLEVLGSLLCGETQAFWRGTIDKLKKAPPRKVLEKLMISYQALDYNQQQIFLDIACFFIGTDKRIASYMWEACHFFPEEGIEVLRFMSLIKIEDDHELRMHDQLRDLGREIVREENQWKPQNHSRLWDSEEVQKVLKENKGTDKIEAIHLSKGSLEGFDKTAERDGNIYTAKQFKNLTNLRFLYMKGAHLSGNFKDSFEELRWLRWPYCPVNFKVNNLHVKELAVLELSYSEINEKWGGWSSFMKAERLKYLDLSHCKSLEDTILLSAFKHLEVLILISCGRLKQIDSSIGDMKALLRLELHRCHSLRELPAEIGSLESLEILDISETGIEELPKGIGRLRKLREFDASDCSNLKGELPESMCKLSSLQRLDVSGCNQLQTPLPEHLPSSLTDLRFACQSRKLPSLSHLTHLKILYVCGCDSGCMLHSTLVKNSECSQPTDVEESELPQSLNTPFKLEILRLHSCQFVETLDVSQFIHLRVLTVNICDNLLEVRGLDKLIYLETLIVAWCDSIERLLLPKSKSLKILSAQKCEKLAEIQGLDRLELLENLSISQCASIEWLDLPKSGNLKRLFAGPCEKLAKIQGLDRLELLERLDIFNCDSIERLDLPKSGRLKKLDVCSCKNLAEIQGFDTLEFSKLSISGCESLKTIPKLSGMGIYQNYKDSEDTDDSVDSINWK